MLENQRFRVLIFILLAGSLLGLAVWATVVRNDNAAIDAEQPTSPATVQPAPTNQTSPVAPPPAPTPSAQPTVRMPLTQKSLNQAAVVARDFLNEYGTFSYREPAETKLDRLSSYVSSKAQFEPEQLVQDGYLREQLVEAKVRRQATATITAAYMVTQDTAAFLAQVTVNTTSGPNQGKETTNLSISLTKGGQEWKVYDLNLGDEYEGP